MAYLRGSNRFTQSRWDPRLNRRGSRNDLVTYDNEKCLDSLKKIEDLVSGDNVSILVEAADQFEKEIERAFRQKANPEGTRWPPRKTDYPWEFMNRTGTLKSSISTGWGVNTRDGKPKVFGKVADAYYLGGYSRGGGGAIFGAHKPMIAVAGAVHWGRKRSRSAAEWRTKTKYGTSYQYVHGGGTRLRTAASTGVVPARKLFGFGQMAKFRVRRFAERKIKGAHR